jgi:hypothetical protein
VDIHFYADDTEIWLPLNPSEQAAATERMEECLRAVKQWMMHYKLKMNLEKSEYLLIASHSIRRHINQRRSLIISDQLIEPRLQPVRNLGIQMSPDASLEAHVNSISRACYMQIANISKIRRYLNEDALKTVIHCVVTSKMDYGNCLLIGAPAYLLQRLQKIQNTAGASSAGRSAPVLHNRHWLPVDKRIKYKIRVTVLNVLHNTAPSYLNDLIHVHYSDVHHVAAECLFLLCLSPPLF